MTDRIKALEDALTLAANRLHRVALDFDTGSRRFIEALEWADEARAALAASQPATALDVTGAATDAHQADLVVAGAKQAQAVPVKVKPLEWAATAYFGDDPVQHRAGGYVVELTSFNEKWKVTQQPYGGSVKNSVSGYPNAEAAKSAAQADYEARIMAALDVQPLTVQDAARALLSDPDAVAKLARAYDREDSAQRGEADPHDGRLFPTDPEWEGERIACATAALRAIAEGRA